MNREYFLKTNLSALAETDKELYLRLSVFFQTCDTESFARNGLTVNAASADSANGGISDFYSFTESRNGETVPVLKGQSLHSLFDPKREAERLVSTIKQGSGFLIFLGFGGGFLPEAALEQTDAHVTVIDFSLKGILEIFSSRDFTHLIKNNRFSFLADPSREEIKSFVIDNYKPAIYGGIQIIPLRARVEAGKPLFDDVIAAVQEAIEIVSGDYTVQAHFGKRWFSNIIRNIKQLANNKEQLTINNEYFTVYNGQLSVKKPVLEAAIAAAGPSLDEQLQALAELKARNAFIISTDTALPVLARNGITPDAVVSIDCQHISYYHFLNCSIRGKSGCKQDGGIPLFLDIASPPLLSRLSGFTPVFFAGGHPLARYIASLPPLDTSGANVTYACLSAAELLGAKRIRIFGADFSYINSQSYARGTYIYPYFYKRQNRLSPIETHFSKFLYRSPFLPPEDCKEQLADNKSRKYFETSSLRFYRKKLEERASMMRAEIICAAGFGAPVTINNKQKTEDMEQFEIKNGINAENNYFAFLEKYRNDIEALPEAESKENYFTKLNAKNRQIFTTLLPYIAAAKKHKPELTLKELIKEAKNCCAAEIEHTLG